MEQIAPMIIATMIEIFRSFLKELKKKSPTVIIPNTVVINIKTKQ
jgi:mannose/fructose/N-acetylgalactosamine-specific phosphotransferase system component IID